MILDDFQYATVSATYSGTTTGCGYGFDTGELTYGESFQPRVYAGSDEEHVSRSYISTDVKDGCYKTVTLEAVSRGGEHPGVALEGLYLSEGRSQGFVTGESTSGAPVLSVGRFFYIGNVGNISEAVLKENSLILSASAADYTITVTLTKESAANRESQQTDDTVEKQNLAEPSPVQQESQPEVDLDLSDVGPQADAEQVNIAEAETPASAPGERTGDVEETEIEAAVSHASANGEADSTIGKEDDAEKENEGDTGSVAEVSSASGASKAEETDTAVQAY